MSQDFLNDQCVLQDFFLKNSSVETFLVDKFKGTAKLNNSNGKVTNMVLVEWKTNTIPLSYIGPNMSEKILSNAEEEVKIVGFSKSIDNLNRKDKVMMRVNILNKSTNKTRQIEMRYCDVQRLYTKELVDFYASKMIVYSDEDEE